MWFKSASNELSGVAVYIASKVEIVAQHTIFCFPIEIEHHWKEINAEQKRIINKICYLDTFLCPIEAHAGSV